MILYLSKKDFHAKDEALYGIIAIEKRFGLVIL